MTRLGPGRTRATLAWLSGAIMAFALIGTCLALLRSDILPFRDAWPTAHGSRTPVSRLAPPQAASRPAGRPSFAAQPTTSAGGPTIGLPGVPTTGGALPIAGSGPLAATPGSSGTSGATGARLATAPQVTGSTPVSRAPGSLPSQPDAARPHAHHRAVLGARRRRRPRRRRHPADRRQPPRPDRPQRRRRRDPRRRRTPHRDRAPVRRRPGHPGRRRRARRPARRFGAHAADGRADARRPGPRRSQPGGAVSAHQGQADAAGRCDAAGRRLRARRRRRRAATTPAPDPARPAGRRDAAARSRAGAAGRRDAGARSRPPRRSTRRRSPIAPAPPADAAPAPDPRPPRRPTRRRSPIRRPRLRSTSRLPADAPAAP